VLDVGCGVGRLCRAIARPGRQIIGIDLSPGMIRRAGADSIPAGVSLVCGDFMTADFHHEFDCVISSAAMHHMPVDAFDRLRALVRPAGRLIVQDLRRDEGVLDQLRAYTALAHKAAGRFVRTGRLRTPPHVLAVMDYWERVGQVEREWLLRLLFRIEDGDLAFLGEPMGWTPAPDDPGHQMSADRERYLAMLRS